MRTLHLILSCLLVCACDPLPAQNSGTVSLTQTTVAGARLHTLFAAFVEVPLNATLRGELPGCERLAEDGLCRALDCAASTSIAGPSAGTIRARVGGSELLSAERGESGAYGASGSGDAFAPGDSVTLSATGDEVGAFEATVVAPAALDVALPSTIDRTAPLTLQWSASIAAEEVSISLTPPAGGTMVTCRLPASDGEVTISPGLLGQLATGTVAVSVSAYNASWQRPGGLAAPGDYDVLVMVAENQLGSALVE